MAKYLIQIGVATDEEDKETRTAYDIAESDEMREVLRVLQQPVTSDAGVDLA